MTPPPMMTTRAWDWDVCHGGSLFETGGECGDMGGSNLAAAPDESGTCVDPSLREIGVARGRQISARCEAVDGGADVIEIARRCL